MLVIIAPRLVAIIFLVSGLVANINNQLLQISQRKELQPTTKQPRRKTIHSPLDMMDLLIN